VVAVAAHDAAVLWLLVAAVVLLVLLVTINRAMAIQEGDDLEPVNVSLKV